MNEQVRVAKAPKPLETDVAVIAQGAREVLRMFQAQQKILGAMHTLQQYQIAFDREGADKLVSEIERDILACHRAYK